MPEVGAAFEPAKEEFNLPAMPVEFADLRGAQRRIGRAGEQAQRRSILTAQHNRGRLRFPGSQWNAPSRLAQVSIALSVRVRPVKAKSRTLPPVRKRFMGFAGGTAPISPGLLL